MLGSVLMTYVARRFRKSVLTEAWAEFVLADTADIQLPEPLPDEFETIFLPWFLYNWVDDGYFDISRDDLQEKPPALLYLEEHPRKLDPFQKRFIEAVCSEYYSFFVVTGVVPGQRMEMKDLFLGRTVSVHERLASESVRVGYIVYARVTTMDEITLMVGCAPLAIPSQYHAYFIDLREHWDSVITIYGARFLFEYDSELREVYHELAEQIRSPELPKLVNNEDQSIEQIKLFYQLDCSVEDAFHALCSLATSISKEDLYQRGHLDAGGNLQSIEIPWLEKLGTEKLAGQLTLKASLSVSKGELVIEVNSRERAESIKQKISRRLGKRAVFKNSVIQSLQHLMKEARSQPAALLPTTESVSKELEAQPEVQAMLREMAKKHWEEWLDKPLPALKNKTPRESAKTASGRERLNALFLGFEGKRNASDSAPFDPDIDALKKALGMR